MDPDESRHADGGSTFAGLAPNVFQFGTDGNVPNPVGAEVFRLFLEHGANPNTLKEKEPLIFSVWGNVDSVREMLDHGADINLRDLNGDTPLLFYLWNGRWAAALLLVQRGAGINVQNTFGTTPELALANGKHIAEDIMRRPLPDDFHKVQAALAKRRH
jgi:ankyrin repeat protein